MDNTFPNQSQGVAPQNLNPSNLTPYILQKMKDTATWMNVIGVILLILTTLIFIAAIFILAAGIKTRLVGFGGVSSVVAVIYILFGILFYLIPGILLIAHANKLKNFSHTNNIPVFEDAISKGKTFWTYTGILTLIVTIIFFIAVIISIVVMR